MNKRIIKFSLLNNIIRKVEYQKNTKIIHSGDQETITAKQVYLITFSFTNDEFAENNVNTRLVPLFSY